MPLGIAREKVLYGLAAARGKAHRYTWWRWGIGLGATLGIALLPWTDTLRFDLWGGHHRWLGDELDFVTVAKRFAFPFLAVNVAIVLLSRFVGRYLCGFACPWGALSRLSEWLRYAERKKRVSRALGTLAHALACLGLVWIAFTFWVDPRVFKEGSTLARVISGAFLLGGFLAFWLGTHTIGLRFCREWCPSGVYFAVLGPESSNGVEFAHPEACTECKACERVCPVDLEPRHMAAKEFRAGMGFYPEKMTSYSLCLRCGDCIAACEDATHKNDTPVPLRLGWLHETRTPAAPGAQDEHASEPAPPARASADEAQRVAG